MTEKKLNIMTLQLGFLSTILFYLDKNIEILGPIMALFVSVYIIYKMCKHTCTIKALLQALALFICLVYISLDHINTFKIMEIVFLISMGIAVYIIRKIRHNNMAIGHLLIFSIISMSTVICLSEVAAYFGYYNVEVSLRYSLGNLASPAIGACLGPISKMF